MATTPTNLPVPSESPRDLKSNAGKIDEFVTSLVNTYVDRFGNAHYTIEGLRWLAQQAIAQYGWILIDSFQDGADITLPNQALRDEATGEYYRWDGDLPKHVDAGSTPTSTGGVGVGAWIGIGDSSLRGMLASKDGYSLIGELQSVAEFNGMTGVTGKKVRLKGWYAGSTIGGGEFYFDATIAKSNHDGGVYISPTVPYTTPENFIKGSDEADPTGNGCWVRVVSMPWIHSDWYGLNSTVDAGVVMNAVSKRAALMRLAVQTKKGTYTLKTQWNHTWIPDGSGRYPIPNIYGDGGEFTTFICDYASFGDSTYGAIFTGSKHIGQENFKFYGIGFQTNAPNDVAGQLYRGACVKFTDIWGFDIDDIRVSRAAYGMTVDNCIYGKGSNWRTAGCHAGTRFRHTANIVGGGSGTGVNAVVLTNCRWADCAHQCLVMSESHNVQLITPSFEGNGNRLDGNGNLIVGDSCVRITQTGGAGGIGVILETPYFESNRITDVLINHSYNQNNLHVIRNGSFNKTPSIPPAAPRVVVFTSRPPSELSKRVTLCMSGCNFFLADGAVDTNKDVEFSTFDLNTYGWDRAHFIETNNVFDTGPAVSSGVLWRNENICSVGVSAAGVLSNMHGAKTCTKTATGVYDIRFATSLVGAQVSISPKLAGFATWTVASNQLIVSIVNASGAAQDTAFDMLVTN